MTDIWRGQFRAKSRLMQCSVKLIHAVSFALFGNRIDSDMRES
jgi:hypothetical protein